MNTILKMRDAYHIGQRRRTSCCFAGCFVNRTDLLYTMCHTRLVMRRSVASVSTFRQLRTRAVIADAVKTRPHFQCRT